MSAKLPLKDVFLHPGECVVADEHCRISTLLGSCVAITLWHPTWKIGAMSHFLLPTQNKKASSSPNARYGDEVLGLMLQELAKLGVSANECQAKIFGGANMFPHLTQLAQPSVGQKNGRFARELLQSYHIPIVSESLFGVGHRKIVFEVGTGEVHERRGSATDEDVTQRKRGGA